MSHVNLRTEASRREIANLRSQITDVSYLRKMDDFIARNSTFDFNNDEHMQALRKTTCSCTTTVSPTIEVRPY